ncbi:MAG: hypothetical protein O7F74_00175 [Bacteroidetes bacterium]|nr:hypothetical protein [Bacteroidota bacterium]
MSQSSMELINDQNESIALSQRSAFLMSLGGGAIAGLAGVLLNNIYSIIYTQLTGISISEYVNITTITLASFLPCLLAGMVYFGLCFYTKNHRVVFIVGAIMFTLFSLLAPLSSTMPDGSPIPPGFAGLTIPMHIISAALLLVILPSYYHRQN